MFRYDDRNIVVRLAQRGLVVFAVEYRLARAASPSWPAVLGDLRAAVRWVRGHASGFHVDADRIAVIGQSSGGHLAALLATLPDDIAPDGVSSQIGAVVSFYSPFELNELATFRRLAHEPAHMLLGAGASPLKDRMAQESPIEHLSRDVPPMLLVHGSDDAWVPVNQALRMAAALAQAGIPHRLIVVEGARHGFETLVQQPTRRDLLPEILAFLETAWNSSVVAERPRAVLPKGPIVVDEGG
jgi:acetyl esterase/lipase